MPSEEAAFNVGGRERCCRFVGVDGLVVALEASEQVGAGGVEPVIAGEVEAIDQGEGRRGAGEFAHGDGPVQDNHGSRCEGEELVVERDDL